MEKVQAAIQKLKEKTSYTLERHATIILTDHQESFEETEEQKLGENDLNFCSQESLEVQFILSNGPQQEQEEKDSDLDSETSIKPGSPVKTNTIPDFQCESEAESDHPPESRTKPEPPQPRPRTIFLSENNISEISQEQHQSSKVSISLYPNSENQSNVSKLNL